MTMPFYVSPEQLIKDRADFARKGISRGRPVVVLSLAGGILLVTENASRALHKISEIYDRIAFAAVGKYNEFESLRVAGIRYADLRGYSYDRTDVSGRALANAYAQTLGSGFSAETKPLEVELVVAEVGDCVAADQIYRISFDGSVAEMGGSVAIGGQAEAAERLLGEGWHADLSLPHAMQLAVAALAAASEPAGTEAGASPVVAERLEAGLLERGAGRRVFRRLDAAQIAAAFEPGEDQQA